jgi:hypothetical protein
MGNDCSPQADSLTIWDPAIQGEIRPCFYLEGLRGI